MDIGSNTFSCAELSHDNKGCFVVTKDTSRPVRLSENLQPGYPLDKKAIERGFATLRNLYLEFEMNKIPTRAVSTSVLRIASNPNMFTDIASKIIGTKIEVIDGETEAMLGSRGAILNLPESSTWTVVDVGGRSTELCIKPDNNMWQPQSISIGMIEITNEFLLNDPPTMQQIENMNQYIVRSLCNAVKNSPQGYFVGVAGTASTLGVLESGLSGWHRELVHGKIISIEKIKYWLDELISLSVINRQLKYGLGKIRADVLPAGLCIYYLLMKHFNIKQMIISANGLRVGAALSILKQ